MKAPEKTKRECRRVCQAFLEAFDDGRLGELDRSMANHLQNCSYCQVEFARMKALAQGLNQSATPDPGAAYWVNFVPNMRRQMQANLAKASPDLSWLPSFAVALGVAVLMLLSPAQISPPSWWLSDAQVKIADTELSSQELAALGQALRPDQKQNAYLDEVELQFIESLSRTDREIIEDPLEELSTMSDAAVEKFFEYLKSRAVIRS